MKIKLFSFLLFILIVCWVQPISAQKVNKKWVKDLNEQIEESTVFSKNFTGFTVMDAETTEVFYEHEADKYYTPASNTKIFTLYTSLKVLGETMPALHYQEQDSAIVFWGTGDPSFLHHGLPKDTTVLSFLKNSSKPLYFSSHNFKTERFGSGWAWDDYPYAFQPDKSPMPIYSNLVSFIREEKQSSFYTVPAYFKNLTRLNPSIEGKRARFFRHPDTNIFECNAQALAGKKYKKRLPFKYSEELFLNILGEATNRKIEPFQSYLTIDSIYTLYSMPVDSVYKRLMQNSDNFIAEQLILTCSNELFGVQDTEKMLEYAIENYLQNLPDPPVWRDGSGLSRYNLFTPRSVAKLLELLYREVSKERLFNIFPAGGVSGTIEDNYGGAVTPYVYAKTGTLSNMHCLSGYLVADSGRVLIFSFMHNNYTVKTKVLKEEMEKILKWLKEYS